MSVGEIKLLRFFGTCTGSQFRVLVMTSKAPRGLGLRYLKDYWLKHEPTKPLRTLGESLLWVLPLIEARLVSTKKRTFPVVMPSLWNSLFRESHLAQSLLSFRRRVKVELYKWTFNIFFFNMLGFCWVVSYSLNLPFAFDFCCLLLTLSLFASGYFSTAWFIHDVYFFCW